MIKENKTKLIIVPKGRLIMGGIIFILGFLSPLLIPLVIASDLTPVIKSLVSGLLALGIPELFMLIAVAVLGKPGFTFLKSKIFNWFNKYGPPDTVSLLRYRVGLIFFLIPIILGFILPYIWEYVPFIKHNILIIVISGDVVLLFSLFILGGDFWDKLRSLFVYNSQAVLLEKPQQ